MCDLYGISEAERTSKDSRNLSIEMSTLGDRLEIMDADADVRGIEMDSRMRSVVRRDEVRFEQLNHQQREPVPPHLWSGKRGRTVSSQQSILKGRVFHGRTAYQCTSEAI
jgi:hypothetical protein